MPTDFLGNAIFSVVPTVILALIFWYIVRAIMRSDRTARRVYDEIEAEERAKAGLPPRSTAASTSERADPDEAPRR